MPIIKLYCMCEQKLLQPSSTHWLSYGNCVTRLKEILSSVIISLERESVERGDAKATGLHALICDYEFIATLLLFCDTLPTINRLSKCFNRKIWIMRCYQN